MKRLIIIGVVAIAPAILSGCSSSRSTLLTRNECNTGWNKVAHLHGTPITLKVPTHLRVYIYQKHFIERVNVAGVTRWQQVELPAVYDFGSEVLYTDKIFTTDFIRPAAGAFNLKVDYTDDQYIQKVQQDITDETLKEVGNLIEKLPGLFVPKPAAALAGGEPASTLQEVKSVIAANVFEIEDPGFEANVSSFVQEYLNSRSSVVAHSNNDLPLGHPISMIHPAQ